MLDADVAPRERRSPAERVDSRRSMLHVHALVDSLTCGGAEVLLAELAAVAPKADLRLTVGFLDELDGNPVAARLRTAGVEPALVGVPRLLAPSSMRTVRRHLAAVQPDLVHTHLGYSDVLGGLAARSLGIPSVSTVHAMDWRGPLRERVKARLAFVTRRACARRIIVVSRSARRAYLEHSHVDPTRVVTIPNGVVGRPMTGSGRAIRTELGLRPTDRVVAMTAPMRTEKGHQRAFAALASLRDGLPQLRALLLGAGADRSEIESQASSLGGTVLALGYRSDVMAVLDAADAVLHTPVTDALPTGLIEAAAAGVPVVASAVGGIPEIVQHESTGLLVGPEADPEEIATALGRLLRDSDLRSCLGVEARRRFEARFSARIWAERLRGIYEAALAEQ
jgi:glycosyltransferase involved in cell wall biosynthesis